jgi:hypothetical protein
MVFPVSTINGPETKASFKNDLLEDGMENGVESFRSALGGLLLNDRLQVTQTIPITSTWQTYTDTKEDLTKLKTSGSVTAFSNFERCKGKVNFSAKGLFGEDGFNGKIAVKFSGERNFGDVGGR